MGSSCDGSVRAFVTSSSSVAGVRFALGVDFLTGSGVTTVGCTAEATRVPCKVDNSRPDGTLRFVDAWAFLGIAANGPTPGADESSGSEGGDAPGWPRAGRGRLKGSGLDLRESLYKVLVVVFCTAAYVNLRDLFTPEDMDSLEVAGLEQLRHQYSDMTNAALGTRAWSLGPSGSVGALLKFGTGGSRDDAGRHMCVGVQAEVTAKGIVCTCSEAENCLEAGCSLQVPTALALDSVRAALGVTMGELFSVLSAGSSARLRAVGRARFYGRSLCVVRMTGGSWPFAVVRKTRAHNWICILCRTNDANCGHVEAAGALAKRVRDGEAETDSDKEECSTDGDASGDDSEEIDNGEDLATGTGVAEPQGGEQDGGGDGPAAGPEPPVCAAPGAAAVLPSDASVVPPTAAAAGPPTVAAPATLDNSRLSPQSRLPRHLVPPASAQRELAEIMEALRDPTKVIIYPAAHQCQHCGSGRSRGTLKYKRAATVECAEGVASASVTFWRCSSCKARGMPDGRDRGVVFQSTTMIYSGVFLCETAVGLSRNGCSLRSSAYLREALNELKEPYLYPRATKPLSSVTTLRKGVVLYISLVIKGVPPSVTLCRKCRRADGSYKIVCFDGLQLGYRIKYKIPFKQTSVRVGPIARASVYARVVHFEWIAKALGRVFVNTPVTALTAAQKRITTVAGLRGHVMALIALVGRINSTSNDVTFIDEVANPARKDAEVGWDPVADGGVRPEFVLFLRGFFRLGRAARALALCIQDAAADLLRRVPQRLKDLIGAVVADLSDSGHPSAVAGIRPAVADDDGAEGPNDWASDGEPDGDVGLDMENVLDEYPPAPYQPRVLKWDQNAPLRPFAEQLSEPSLADTGGTGGERRAGNCVLPLKPECPSTAASNEAVINFLRAVTVDPVTVWAPRNKWTAVLSLVATLEANNFSSFTLAATLSRPEVAEQRLLRSAVACLGPAIVVHRHLRLLLASLLRSLQDTMANYEMFVADKYEKPRSDEASSSSDGDDGGDGGDGGDGDDNEDEDDISRETMANAHPHYVFSAMQYTKTWLRPVATAAGFKALYNEEGDQDDDILKTGIWAPGLPILRALPNFVGAAVADTDVAACNHEMGKEKVYTGGSFGAFCTCTHPKCIGVKILDGSEGQRMPLEFVLQRFATLPAVIVYDFACATLKTALLRLPYVAKRVQMLVDRFHWRKSHTDCSTAMCPDALKTMDGINTSSSEERNALARRQQHHLRLVKQDQFILFTVYQQSLSNVMAMYRDDATATTTIKWPEWFRRTHVDK